MDQGVGTILREARDRREVKLPEVEAATRIRLRYLRAIENEEWDVLPGGVYTRGFIRTYASFLGLDGERLAGDYRQSVEGGHSGPAEPTQPAATGPRVGRPPMRRFPRRLAGWLAVVAVVAVAVIAIVAIPGGDKGGDGATAGSAGRRGTTLGDRREEGQQRRALGQGVSVRLSASAEVWVCMLDARGEALVDGQILEAGAHEGPFHSGSFTVSFGNGEVSMLIDGREAEIPATSSPIGYSIDSSGAVTELSEAERPTCT
jgi:cytoskeleton protein RodZ